MPQLTNQPAVRELRPTYLINSPERLGAYCDEFVEQQGAKGFLNSLQNYSHLQKVQTNLYKCFITRGWDLVSASGITAMIHLEGIYDDPKGGSLRKNIYSRLRYHYHFRNELLLFDIDDKCHFGVSVYGPPTTENAQFWHISGLFHPSTVDGCYLHDGQGSIPGIKNDQGDWDLRPHRSRLITVDRSRLELFARLYDESGTPADQASLPVIHSKEIVHVLEKVAAQPRKLSDLENEYFATEMWHETNSQKDATIRRDTRYPKIITDWILSGPHFFVGTPFNKTPRSQCEHNSHYDELDLMAIADDYLPRTNYVPACLVDEYRSRIPAWNSKPITEYYRHVHRRQINSNNERTLIGAIVPPGCGHVNTVVSCAFLSLEHLVAFAGLASSLVYDFILKSTGKSDVYPEQLGIFPFPTLGQLLRPLVERTLRLTCLTRHYASLWESHDFGPWHRGVAFRTDLSRRKALVETDALAALALSLSR